MMVMRLNVSRVSGFLAWADVNRAGGWICCISFLLLNVTDEIRGEKKAGIKWVCIIKRRGGEGSPYHSLG